MNYYRSHMDTELQNTLFIELPHRYKKLFEE